MIPKNIHRFARKDRSKIIKRPYATHYYAPGEGRFPSFVSQGACCSDRGAIRATVVRIFMGEYVKAVIYDRIREVPLYTVSVGSEGLKIHYGAAVSNPPVEKVMS